MVLQSTSWAKNQVFHAASSWASDVLLSFGRGDRETSRFGIGAHNMACIREISIFSFFQKPRVRGRNRHLRGRTGTKTPKPALPREKKRSSRHFGARFCMQPKFRRAAISITETHNCIALSVGFLQKNLFLGIMCTGRCIHCVSKPTELAPAQCHFVRIRREPK